MTMPITHNNSGKFIFTRTLLENLQGVSVEHCWTSSIWHSTQIWSRGSANWCFLNHNGTPFIFWTFSEFFLAFSGFFLDFFWIFSELFLHSPGLFLDFFWTFLDFFWTFSKHYKNYLCMSAKLVGITPHVLLKHRKVALFTPCFALNIPYVPRLRAHQYLNRYCMLFFEIHATQSEK